MIEYEDIWESNIRKMGMGWLFLDSLGKKMKKKGWFRGLLSRFKTIRKPRVPMVAL